MQNIHRPTEASETRCDVLILEDDLFQCEELVECLSRAGLTVTTAHDGASALIRAEALQPRVALLDYNLPDMTGTAVAEQIKSLSPFTSIILMSGRIEGVSGNTLDRSGITVFVNKPVPLSVLRQAVLKLVRQGVSMREPPRTRSWFAGGIGSRPS
jgi:CheY-like chemotaxis protein